MILVRLVALVAWNLVLGHALGAASSFKEPPKKREFHFCFQGMKKDFVWKVGFANTYFLCFLDVVLDVCFRGM